jgi:phage gpG-like protein
MDPDDLAAFLETLKGSVATAAAPVANAMGETMKNRVQVILKEKSHAPGEFYRAQAGASPAYATGNLSRSIVRTPAFGGLRATSMVGATAVYAGVQEFGGYTWGNHGFMHWVNSAGSWFMKTVYIPEHPYMRPAVEGVIRDGSLRQSAIDAFMAHMSPLIR